MPIRSHRFIRRAHDAALNDANAAELCEFLTGKLSPEDLAEFCRRAGIDSGAAMDEPEPFNGRPRPGGAMDRRRTRLSPADEANFAGRFPHAAKIKVTA